MIYYFMTAIIKNALKTKLIACELLAELRRRGILAIKFGINYFPSCFHLSMRTSSRCCLKGLIDQALSKCILKPGHLSGIT